MNWAELATVEFFWRVGRIILIDLMLAGDNAVVIALAVRNLPRRQQFQGRIWGTFGAVALRVLFIGIITFLLRIPLLQAAGGCVLLWIAVKLLVQGADEGGEHHVRQGTSLGEAVWIIIVADVIMSLDNVLAVAGAAGGDMLLVIFGVGLSIPVVIWGSGILARLMGRFPVIVDVGAAILGWVAGEMVVKDEVVQAAIGEAAERALHWVLPAVLALAVVAVGRWLVARRIRQSRPPRARDAART
jgi:YjbE family integral membrane protein